MATKDFDVAIVGMGPVGAAAALLLAHEGLSVAVVEKAPEIYELPRAVAIDGEVVRAFQRLGLAESLVTVLQAVRPGERAGFANSRGEWLFGQPLVPFGRNGWQPISMFDQPELEQFIRGQVAASEHCSVFLNEEVLAAVSDDHGVRITTSQRTFEADWLIACDGAASPVRKSLGIGWEDLGYDHDWLVVDVTLKPGVTLAPETLQICDPDRLVTYVGTRDPFRRWEFKLKPGESASEVLDDEFIETLIEPWLPRTSYEMRRKAVYQFHAATATSWREGRIFLAGDAAHQTPPFLGQGLNAGMRDVINLSWKLGLVQRGICDVSLLDTYQSERMPHAQDLVEWAVSLGQLMEHLAAAEAAERAGQPAPAMPPQKRASGYGQGREAPPLRRGVLKLEQVSDSGSTGYLFCQPDVSPTNQATCKLDQLLGDGFALVSSEPIQLSDESQSIIERLGIQVCLLAGLTEARGHFDPLFEAATTALVRPDRYVYGHTTESVSADELLQSLASSVKLT